jgi:hypothetical protein
MTYETTVNTPLLNADKALFSLREALYDLANTYSALGDYEASGAFVSARDALVPLERLVREYEKKNTEALYRELEDSGLI